jgi:hypothetical protein
MTNDNDILRVLGRIEGQIEGGLLEILKLSERISKLERNTEKLAVRLLNTLQLGIATRMLRACATFL